MIRARIWRALALPTLVLAGAAGAQESSFELGAIAPPKLPPPLYVSAIEAGIGYQSLESFHFGRYGGVTAEGPFAILKGAISTGDAWNAEGGDHGGRFWTAAVDLKGFGTYALAARGGQRGRWRMAVFADGFTRALSDSAATPFFGAGTDRLVLPGNWLTGVSSARFTRLEQSLKPVDLKVAWRTVGGDFVLTPLEGYEVRLQFSTRNRQGIRPQSLAFGQEGNFSVGVFFPLPVDYDTHQATLSLAYADPRLQWAASYNVSVFTSVTDAVMVPNPFSGSLSSLVANQWPAGAFAGFPLGFGQYGLPPDSAAHQFLVSGGYAISPKTRLTLRLSYALQSQDETFLPYTANSQLLAPVPLPRESLGGQVAKLHFALNLASREWKDVDLSMGYTLDDRRNRSPSDIYSYVANDVQDQIRPTIPGNSRYIRINLPHSFSFHQAKAEAGYRLAPRTRLSLSYTGDFRWRDYQQVARTAEQVFKAKVLSTFASGSAWLSAGYAFRDGSDYDSALAWDLSHTEAYLNSAPTSRSIEQPFMRKYNLADRRRTEAKGGLTFDASSSLAISSSGGFAKDNYVHSPIGLRSSEAMTFDIDASYVIAKGVTASAFYALDRIRSFQNGYLIFDTTAGNPARNWSVRNRDTVHSAGARLGLQVVPEKFKLDAAYTLADGTSRTGVQSTPTLISSVSSPLPAARDITHSGEFIGEYALTPAAAVRLGYTVARHTSRDWQYGGLGATPVAQILGSGIAPPRYTAHVVWLTTRHQF